MKFKVGDVIYKKVNDKTIIFKIIDLFDFEDKRGSIYYVEELSDHGILWKSFGEPTFGTESIDEAFELY